MEDSSFLDFEAPVVDEHWQPMTDGDAEWALMKIQAPKDEVAKRERERAIAIEKWDRYVDAAKREALRDAEFFSAKLHGFLLRLLDAGTLGKKTGYQLPSARLQLRRVEAKWEPSDREAVKAWAEHTDTMRVRWEPDMPAIQQMCRDGVQVPGMTMVRQAGYAFAIIFPHEDKDGVA